MWRKCTEKKILLVFGCDPLAICSRVTLILLRGACVGGLSRAANPFGWLVDGMNVHESRVSNYPPRYNAAPSQDLLVMWRNRKTGEVSLAPLRWGLIPHGCRDPDGHSR